MRATGFGRGKPASLRNMSEALTVPARIEPAVHDR